MTSRRFELDDDTSRKFWEIATEGKANTVRFGRIGTEGQVKTKTHPSERSAQVDAEKLVREKLAKGYVEVSRGPRASAKSTSNRSLVERLEAALETCRRGYVERGMRKPPTGKALDAFRAKVGRSLPDTFYSLYSWCDGSKGSDFCGDLQLMPLASIVETKKLMDELGKTSAAPGQWWNDGWIPFMEDHSYDVVAIDTVGCFGGRPGQIIQFAKDDDTRQILHGSFDGWLETFVTALEKGLYEESKGAFVADDAAVARIHAKVDPGYPKDAFWEMAQAPAPAGGKFALAGTIPANEPSGILWLPAGLVVRQAASPKLSLVNLETHERTVIEEEGEISGPLARLQDGFLYYVVEPEDPDSDCKPGAAVWFFDPRSGKKRRMVELASYPESCSSLQASADGKFAIASAWGWVGYFDTTTWDDRHSVEGEYIQSGIAPDGLTFATCVYKSNTIVVHRGDSGETLRTLEGAADIGTELRFDPSGKYLVAFGGGRAIGRWTLADGELLRLPVGGQTSSIAFSADGRMLVVGTTGGSFRVFDLESGEVLWDAVLMKQGDVTSVTFAATGREIYAVTVDRMGPRPSVIHRISVN